jgi:hypothetical protein
MKQNLHCIFITSLNDERICNFNLNFRNLKFKHIIKSAKVKTLFLKLYSLFLYSYLKLLKYNR